ncbi:MAG: flagellar basal body rod protein FlgB [bacterium]
MELFGNIYNILDDSLNVLSERQNVIASNIANANTPGYKEKTVNFKNVMQDVINSGSSLELKTNSPKDFTDLGLNNSESFGNAFIEKQKVQSVPALDGNTVNLSSQMAEMSSNAIRFQAVAGLLTKKFAMLNYAITQTTP